MHHFKLLATTLGAALLVAACGGGGNGDQSPAIKYSAVVSFGDSLSDPGAYNVGIVKDSGGGMFTVNGILGAVGSSTVPSYTWAQLVSAAAIGQVSCAAREGGYGVPVAIKAGCTNYAQGGSRVTERMGPGYTGISSGVFSGAMTEPIETQVGNFLAASSNSRFTGTELVTVLAGANDLFGQATILMAAATAAGNAEGARVGNAIFGATLVGLLAAGATTPSTAAQAIGLAMGTEAANPSSTQTTIVGAAVMAAASQPGNSAVGSPGVYGPMVVAATSAATTAGTAAGSAAGANYAATTGAQTAVTGMVTAASELAASVRNMLAQGAKRVVVVNLPDVSKTPYALSTISGSDNSTQQLVLAMTTAFNTTLQAGLAGTTGVLFVDAFSENQRQIANPTHYGLTNVTAMACNLDTGVNTLGSSLTCKANKAGIPGNLIAGDTSRYLFADSVHPTPYGQKLLAQYVTKAMVIAGWL
jgi:phospholipase/lecithinase/hemolysin